MDIIIIIIIIIIITVVCNNLQLIRISVGNKKIICGNLVPVIWPFYIAVYMRYIVS